MSDYEIWTLTLQGLSALGTLSAVIAALYLARKDSTPRLTIEVKSFFFTMDTGCEDTGIQINAVNNGRTPVVITNVGFSVGLVTKRVHGVVIREGLHAYSIPQKIDQGEKAEFRLPHIHLDDVIQNVGQAISEYSWFTRRTLQVAVEISTGKTFTGSLPPWLKQKMIAAGDQPKD